MAVALVTAKTMAKLDRSGFERLMAHAGAYDPSHGLRRVFATAEIAGSGPQDDVRVLSEAPEYGVVLFKPDAVAAGIDAEIVGELGRTGFTTIAHRTRTLSAVEVASHTLHPDPENIAFLTSGPVELYLVSGVRCAERLYRFKKAVRAARGVATAMRNLLHTSDDGTEYHALFAAFFGDLPAGAYCNQVDLDLVATPREIEQIADHGRLRFAAVRAEGREIGAVEAVQRRCPGLRLAVSRRLRTGDGDEVVVVAPLDGATSPRIADPFEYARHVGGRAYLASLTAEPAELAAYRQITWQHKLSGRQAERDSALRFLPSFVRVAALARAGLDGVLCMLPGLPLVETELRMDLARLTGLRRAGASAGRALPGEFSVSSPCVLDDPSLAAIFSSTRADVFTGDDANRARVWDGLYHRADRADRPAAEVESVPHIKGWGDPALAHRPDHAWWLDHLPRQDGLVLELGCGNGSRLAAIVRDRGVRGAGFDVSARAIEAGRGAVVAAGLDAAVELAVGSFHVPWPFAGPFDAIYAMYSLHFARASDLPALAARIRAALAPEGIFVTRMRSSHRAVEPSYRAVPGEPSTYVSDEPHERGLIYHHYTRDDIDRLARAIGGTPIHAEESYEDRDGAVRCWWDVVVRRQP